MGELQLANPNPWVWGGGVSFLTLASRATALPLSEPDSLRQEVKGATRRLVRVKSKFKYLIITNREELFVDCYLLK